MSEKHKQLQERILVRQSELLASHELLLREAPDSARLLAIDHSLAALDVHMCGGLEMAGAMMAGQLIKWLDQSQYLVEESAHAAAETILRRLETRQRLDEIGLPSPPQPEVT